MRSELIRRLHSLTLHDGDGDERFADALRGAAAARAAAARTAAARRCGLLYERGGPWASCGAGTPLSGVVLARADSAITSSASPCVDAACACVAEAAVPPLDCVERVPMRVGDGDSEGDPTASSSSTMAPVTVAPPPPPHRRRRRRATAAVAPPHHWIIIITSSSSSSSLAAA